MLHREPKQNIHTEALVKWDGFKDKPFDQALPAVYVHAATLATKMCAWYWRSIRSKRVTSMWARGLTFAFLAAGSALPILAGLSDDSDLRLQCTQVGVVALAVAGLLQLSDRVFGWSSGWLRYVTTVTAMENLTRKFELDWAAYVIDKGGVLAEADKKPLFEIARKFEDELAKMQSNETDKWVTEFINSGALLSEMLKSQREAVEKVVESSRATITAQEKAAQESANAQRSGSIEISLVHKTALAPVRIAVDAEAAVEFTGTSWARLSVTPGQHTVSVNATGAPTYTDIKVVNVLPGDVGRAEFELP